MLFRSAAGKGHPVTSKYFDAPIVGKTNGGFVNYGPNKGRSLEYGINDIVNLHSDGPYHRGLHNVFMGWFGKNKDEISLPNDYYLGSNMGQVGNPSFRASGNPYPFVSSSKKDDKTKIVIRLL